MDESDVRGRAQLDMPTNVRLASIRRTYGDFESRLTQARLVLARSFHETRDFAIEARANA